MFPFILHKKKMKATRFLEIYKLSEWKEKVNGKRKVSIRLVEINVQ